jgi:hypothetical protein
VQMRRAARMWAPDSGKKVSQTTSRQLACSIHVVSIRTPFSVGVLLALPPLGLALRTAQGGRPGWTR